MTTEFMDEAEAKRETAGAALREILQRQFGNRRITRNSVIEAQELIESHCDKARAVGIDFPDLIILAFPRLNNIQVVNRDLDEKSVKTLIVNLTVEMPGITAEEIAAAITGAFPRHAARLVRVH